MEYRSLENESLEIIHQCFNEAFSDYLVPMHLSFEQFQRTLIRNGVHQKFSLGLYDRNNLVGFILNGVGTWNNCSTVYDSGTGILKEYRGKKHSKKMFAVLKRNLLHHGFSQYLLEVIQTNTPALTLYCNQGFKIERELLCFTIEKETLPKANLNFNVHFKKMSVLPWDVVTTFWNAPPSWQNSIHAVKRCVNQFERIGAYKDNTFVGYAIFDPQSGEIVHIAVRKNVRRKGIGSALLNRISAETEGAHLRIINVDKRDDETVNFLKGNGFINDVNQYEMVLHLKNEHQRRE